MHDSQVEKWIYDYIVAVTLKKALEWDGRNMAPLKLSRVWRPFVGELASAVDRELAELRRRLRVQGCRIALEEIRPNKNVHIMYVYKGYEYHCEMLPTVLKGRCEEKLRGILSKQRGMNQSHFLE